MKVVYSQDYQDLFDRAMAVLKESHVTDDDGSEIVIGDLPSYYRWLDVIEQIGGPEFLRSLPLDEECFEIDTNTRKIIMPDMIGKGEWVVGVKDDHLAEVLWFHVDRFFDGQDLAICFPVEGEGVINGQTYIQWKNGSGQGLDPVQHVQIDENNIWFGWYLRSNNGVLNTSGDLTFTVRFQYHKGGTEEGPDLNSEVLFSFNTLPVTCKVLTNLTESMGSSISGIKDLQIEDTSNQGSIRPRFSGVFDSTNGPKAYISKENDLPVYKDLDDSGNAVFEIIADGSGTLHYRWYKNGTLIEGAEANTYTADSIGVYSCQVGNEYKVDKIRWTDSNPCEIPAASELEFAKDGNIMAYGYANAATELSVNVERKNDAYGRNDKGEISYTWYREALEGETLNEMGDTLAEVSTDETYTPAEGEVGYFYVSMINTYNKDASEPLVSEKCTMKVPAEMPRKVTISFNDVTHMLHAEVDIDHKNDLWYEWNSEEGVRNAPVLAANTFKVTVPGTYYCKVYQHVYPGTALESVSQPAAAGEENKKRSNSYVITAANLK